ncbi:MAG TPA: hypothetical protein VG796_14020 [Verrucomicrobiales bacterium]|nr:hypothetical protein [Verrucomicrobiales bacterium]
MKAIQLVPSGSALLAVSALFLTSAAGQTETKPAVAPDPVVVEEKTTEETTSAEATEATGSVFSVDADTFSVTPKGVKIPLNFMYNSKTTFVDESDKSVPWDQMRAGLPVTVHYNTLGEKMLATKVTVTRKMIDGGKADTPSDEAAAKRAELAEAKKRKDAVNAALRTQIQPAASGGTIMSFEQVISVRPQGATNVVQYVINNSTHFVDTASQPVPLNMIRTGAPVSIQFVEDAGRNIATQVMVERMVSTDSSPTSNAIVSRTFGTSGTDTGTAGSTTSATTSNFTNGGGTGTLADSFINPPITVLPGTVNSNSTQPGTNTNPATGNANNTNTSGTARTTPQGPVPTGPQVDAPRGTQAGNNTTQPAAGSTGPAQPGNTQPATTQPGTRQPATTQPGTRPAGSGRTGTGAGGAPSSGGARSSSPGTAPAAPGGR